MTADLDDFQKFLDLIAADPEQFVKNIHQKISTLDIEIDRLLANRPKRWEIDVMLKLTHRNSISFIVDDLREINFSELVQSPIIHDLGKRVKLIHYKNDFLAKMKSPGRQIKVLIADSFEPSIRGIRYLLSIWPNLEVQWVSDGWDCQNLGCDSSIDILLLDHNLSSRSFNNSESHCFTGNNFYWMSIGRLGYKFGGFNGQLISIADQPQPYSVYNFTQKMHISAGYLNVCYNFIDIVNQAIARL
jgi:hypothetical protein